VVDILAMVVDILALGNRKPLTCQHVHIRPGRSPLFFSFFLFLFELDTNFSKI